jgi:hypothetical protein
MLKLLLPACVASALTFVLVSSTAQTPAPAAKNSAESPLASLGWLAGEWRGKAESADVVSWHSDPDGGMIVMATKELTNGKVSLFDFGIVSERNGKAAFVPYPYGKPSVAFLLEGHDPKVQRARFANADHDFPKSFLFERKSADELSIVLEGDEGGKPTKVEYALKLVRTKG